MSDETPGVTQGALPPREGQQGPRAVAERPAVRLTQVAGAQYVLTTSQPHGVPALTQVSRIFLNGAKITLVKLRIQQPRERPKYRQMPYWGACFGNFSHSK
jgi:hypothetical protein